MNPPEAIFSSNIIYYCIAFFNDIVDKNSFLKLCFMKTNNWNPPYIIGAGGRRLINMKGLVYPPNVLHCSPKEEIHTSPPRWGISTFAAAALLHCSPASARQLLHKRNVESCKVHRHGKAPILYWRQTQVTQIAKTRQISMKHPTKSFITACSMFHAAPYLATSKMEPSPLWLSS